MRFVRRPPLWKLAEGWPRARPEEECRQLVRGLGGDLRDRVEGRHGLVVERTYGAQVPHDAMRRLVVEGYGAGAHARFAVREAVDQEPHHLAPRAGELFGGPAKGLDLLVGHADVQAVRHGVSAQVGHLQGRGASPAERKDGRTVRPAGASPGAQTPVCANGAALAASLSASSAASILATVGVQDGLLAGLGHRNRLY